MKKNEELKRSCRVTLRYTNKEFKQISHLCAKTTCNNLSEYLRLVSLNEPVTILYRNQSADTYLAEFIQLKNELNAIGNNFNQLIKRLHTIRDHELNAWMKLSESTLRLIAEKKVEIIEELKKIAASW